MAFFMSDPRCPQVPRCLGFGFEAQPDSYKSKLLPADVPKMSVEAEAEPEDRSIFGNW